MPAPIRAPEPRAPSSSARQDTRNDLPAVATIDAEVRVSGQKYGIVQCLGHAHETGVRETDRHVGVFLQELEHRVDVVREPKAAHDGAATKHESETSRSASTDQMRR